jgi:hypothetical protein
MTVVAGFPYANGGGILLCADSEHSGGEEKVFRAKLIDVRSDIGSAIFAYAGNMRFARNAINKCQRAICSAANKDRAILDVVADTLESEYTAKVLNVPRHADGAEGEYWYGILVGLWSPDSGLGLYYAEGLMMDPRERPVFCGSGASIAECLMKPLYWRGIELSQLLLSTTYMLFKTKQCSAGVSGPSMFLSLRNDGTMANAGDWLFPERYERALREFDSQVGTMLFSVMDRDLEADDFEKRMEGVQTVMRRMRAEGMGNATEELIERFLRRSGQ